MKALLADAIGEIPCEHRKMFGFPVYFINRWMFAGLFGDEVFVRHSEELRKILMKGTGKLLLFAPMPGRVMKDYALIPPKMVKDSGSLRKILRSSAEHTASLPSKESKPSGLTGKPRTRKA
jgi:TfoX/Sxy family transcriptional regulator of competence genes